MYELNINGPKKQVTDKESERKTVSVGTEEVELYRLWYAAIGRCQVTFDPLRTLGILSWQDSTRPNNTSRRRRERRGIPEKFYQKTEVGFGKTPGCVELPR